jgi:nuclear transport factor 2 (NTF2) superfamily protein
MNNQAFIWMLLRAQKVAESLFAKYIRIALATFRKFDDSFGYAVAGVKTAPVSLNSLASRFECNAHDPRGFWVKLFTTEEWCDWHESLSARRQTSIEGIRKGARLPEGQLKTSLRFR